MLPQKTIKTNTNSRCGTIHSHVLHTRLVHAVYTQQKPTNLSCLNFHPQQLTQTRQGFQKKQTSDGRIKIKNLQKQRARQRKFLQLGARIIETINTIDKKKKKINVVVKKIERMNI